MSATTRPTSSLRFVVSIILRPVDWVADTDYQILAKDPLRRPSWDIIKSHCWFDNMYVLHLYSFT